MDRAAAKDAKEALHWELLLWEAYRARLRGVRTCSRAVSQAIGLLNETFRPGQCFLARATPNRHSLEVLLWAGGSQGEIRAPASAEERGLLERWEQAIGRVIRGRSAIKEEGEEGALNFLCPLTTSERSHGVMVLTGLAPRYFGLRQERVLRALLLDLAERLALLEGGEERGQGGPAGEAEVLRRALEEERQRVRELETLLERIADEVQNREKALKQMTQQWLSVKTFNDSVLHSLSSGLIAVDTKGRITYMNRGAERILQYGADEVMGKNLGVAMASKDKVDLLSLQDQEGSTSVGRQIQLMRKDGVEIPVGFTISSHLDPGGREIGKIIHFRDLVEINEMQEELLRMDRLVSLGEISMGIAHEIRNPLAGIRITAQALEEEVAGNEALKEYVARIIAEIDRLNDLMKSFFSFAKPQKPQRTPCDVRELLRDVLFLIAKDLEKRRIRVEQEHPDELPLVSLDANQMKQVFLNLFLNSIQATSEEGVIRVGTRVSSLRRRKELQIIIADSGRGIAPEHQRRIFDPFFTTKAKGLGLGLSISYRIVKRHGGRIRVQSEPGKGTTFFINLAVEDGSE